VCVCVGGGGGGGGQGLKNMLAESLSCSLTFLVWGDDMSLGG